MKPNACRKNGRGSCLKDQWRGGPGRAAYLAGARGGPHVWTAQAVARGPFAPLGVRAREGLRLNLLCGTPAPVHGKGPETRPWLLLLPGNVFRSPVNRR
jgi:hypothetical protein